MEENWADVGCGCFNPAPIEFCFDYDGDGMGNPGTETAYCEGDVPDGWVLDCMDMTPDGEVNVGIGNLMIDEFTGAGTFDVIYYDADLPLKGYQYQVAGIVISSVESDNADFQLSFNPANGGVVAFSITGGEYAAGAGVLTTVSFMHEGPAVDICLDSVIIAGETGHSPVVMVDPCYPVAEGWTDCEGVYYGPSLPDCNGDCNGLAVIDECGVCCDGDSGTDCSFFNDETDFGGAYDCNGDCLGEAFFDECGVCSAGNSGMSLVLI